MAPALFNRWSCLILKGTYFETGVASQTFSAKEVFWSQPRVHQQSHYPVIWTVYYPFPEIMGQMLRLVLYLHSMSAVGIFSTFDVDVDSLSSFFLSPGMKFLNKNNIFTLT